MGGSRAQTALKIFDHRAHCIYLLFSRTYVSSCANDFTAEFGQSLSLSVMQSAFAPTEQSAALLSRRMRWCHRGHTLLITGMGYPTDLALSAFGAPCRPGESVITHLTHSGFSLLDESYIKAPTTAHHFSGCMGVFRR